MTPQQLFKAGKLDEAIQALSAELRNFPLDVKRRTFLFELLCFAGDYERAEKHLEVLAKESQQSGMGALLYRAALHAERTRMDTFEKKEFPAAQPPAPREGTLNGVRFSEIADADPRIGARLEVLSAGAYMWIPMAHIESIEMQPPKRLRDTLWAPLIIKTGPAFRQAELGESLLPVVYPFSWKHSDTEVRLGRQTVWEEQEDGTEVPFGQKVLLVDGQEIGILEVRKLEFDAAPEEAEAGEASAS
jgi:type VI secretion system protein ImpE